MESLKELKECLQGELEARSRRGNIKSRPWVPMVIVYTDEEALKSRAEIDTALVHVWGDRSQDILQLAVEDGQFLDAGSKEALSADDVQGAIDDMYAAENSFGDMSHLCSVFIHSTTSCEDEEAFRARYEMIESLRDLVSDGMQSAAVVLLDESTRHSKVAKSIRNYLGGLLDADESPYNSVLLLSNRLSDNSLLAGGRIRENYLMVGWLVVLIDSIGGGYRPDWTLFFPAKRDYYLTAAFSEVNRPNEAICDIVLNTMLTWVDRQSRAGGESKGGSLDIDDLYARLGISDGSTEVLEAFYERNVKDNLPSLDELRFLPRQHPAEINLSAVNFEGFNQETMGACSTYLAGIEIFDSDLEDRLVPYLRDYVRDKLSVVEREQGLNPSNVQAIVRTLAPVPPTGRERVDEYIRKQAYALYLEWALPIMERVLTGEQSVSAKHSKELDSIIEEFGQGYFPDNPDLERYYTEITSDALGNSTSRLGERLCADVAAHADSKEAILDSFAGAARELFSANAVFKMPLEQEMMSRMGKDPADIHSQISNMLFRDLDRKTRLKTTIALSALRQYAIVNEHGKDGEDTELYTSIRRNVSDAAGVEYFDSCDNNTIKIVRFYSCAANCLITDEAQETQ